MIHKSLSIRNWTCPISLSTHDRDENASINILNEGLRTNGHGLPITKVEDKSVSSNCRVYQRSLNLNMLKIQHNEKFINRK
jgi:transposase